MASSSPESILDKSREFYKMGQRSQALSVLHEFVTSRFYRPWSPGYETLMMQHIHLCVQQRKGVIAKEGLLHYRNICQAQPQSFENVLKSFIEISTQKADAAHAKSTQFNIDSIDDLEEETPDAILNADAARDRAEREVVTPWLRFLWESYRTVLDIVRNNAKHEKVYQFTVSEAVKFCRKYKRATEFRRLCEILRGHISQTMKYSGQGQNINLANADSMAIAMEIRFTLLSVATELGLWQEAYKTAEDVHSLLNMTKRAPKPILMHQYYTYLSQIFWVSDNHLFHAHAWYRLYSLTKNFNKAVTAAELADLASVVVLSALSIPVDERLAENRTFELDIEKDRNVKLASLLGFHLQAKTSASDVAGKSATLFSIPHLRDLVSNIVNIARNMQGLVVPELKEIYRIMEVEFQPLDLAEKVQPVFQYLEGHKTFSKFLKPLQKAVLSRILLQISQVYRILKLENLSSLVKFASAQEIELHLVGMIKKGLITGRVDHQKGLIIFTKKFTEVDSIRRQLVNFAEGLSRAADMVDPVLTQARKDAKKQLIKSAIQSAQKEHMETIARKRIIERRIQMEQEEAAAAAEDEEDSGPVSAAPAPAGPSVQEQIDEAVQKQVDELLADIAKIDKKKINVKEEFPGVESHDLVRALRKRKADIMRAQREEAEKKVKDVVTKHEYLERGRRDVERPILEERFRKLLEEEKDNYEKQQAQFLEKHKKMWEKDLVEKDRILRMVSQKELFEKVVKSARATEHARKIEESKVQYAEKLRADHILQAKLAKEEAERKKREEEEKAAREAERLKKEEEERAAQEKAQREREAAEKIQREREDAKAEEARLKAELKAASENQKQQLAQERVATQGDSSARPAGKYVPPQSTGRSGGWRERESQQAAAAQSPAAQSPATSAASAAPGGRYRPPIGGSASAGSGMSASSTASPSYASQTSSPAAPTGKYRPPVGGSASSGSLEGVGQGWSRQGSSGAPRQPQTRQPGSSSTDNWRS